MIENRDRLVARYTLEKVKRWIESYEGDPGHLGEYLLDRILDYLDRMDLLLSSLVDRLV
jgi:bisphosphoglycerate-dependent phosphoglycerate mutase